MSTQTIFNAATKAFAATREVFWNSAFEHHFNEKGFSTQYRSLVKVISLDDSNRITFTVENEQDGKKLAEMLRFLKGVTIETADQTTYIPFPGGSQKIQRRFVGHWDRYFGGIGLQIDEVKTLYR